jgi:ADP-heptose:LPS heptosyltransferase
MKTLMLSLMRLGDLLMMEPILSSWKQEKGGELHILMYKEFSYAKDLFPYVDQFHFIDRREMQNTTRAADLSILDNYSTMSGLVDSLRQQNFDNVISLSHNNVCFCLGSLLVSENTNVLGAHEKDGQVFYGSPWIKYLNDIASYEGGSVYHLVDIYKNALGLENIEYAENLADLYYGNQRDIPAEDFICMQLTSNEEKKTFSLDKWANVISHFRLLDMKTKIIVLGAPSEEKELKSFADLLQDDNLEICACDLKTAKALVSRAKLFVTPDTSIKYLANTSDVPVLELSVGSSQLNQTGSYKSNSLILQAKQNCAPCGHSYECPHASFLCQDQIPADLVGFSMFHHKSHDWKSLQIIADEYHDDVDFYRTRLEENAYWTPVLLGELSLEKNLKTILHQATWQVILGEEEVEDWQRFEKAALKVRNFLMHEANISDDSLRKCLEKCEALLLGYELETQELIRSLGKEARASFEDSFERVNTWFERSGKLNLRLKAFSQMYSDISLKETAEEQRFQSTHRILDNLNHMFKIERKISEMIRVDFMEVL